MPSQKAPSTPRAESLVRGQRVAQWLLGCILLFAPLFRSGQPAFAILVLELLAVGVLFTVFWWPRHDLIARRELFLLALLVIVPLLYLLPMPSQLASAMPAWAPYLAAQSLLGGDAGESFRTLSLYPIQTEGAVLLLLVPIGVYLGTRMLDSSRVFQLILLLLGFGAAQALFGLLQFGAGSGGPDLFGISYADVRSAVGTYTNRNHLAGFLEMLLPIALALTFFCVGRKPRRGRRGWRDRVAFLASMRGHVAFVYAMVAMLLLLGVIFTRSRAGIGLTILGIILSTLMFARRLGGSNVYGSTGTVVSIALGGSLAIGLVPVLDRFSAQGAIQDARWPMFSATWDGIGTFAPLGSGFGNYPDVFPLFQPLEFGRWFINHAHNDYLEWLFEGGVLAGALIAFFIALYVRQWTKVWVKGAWSRSRFVQVASGIGILLLMLHSLADFNLHIPANIVYFAFLCGLFFSEPAVVDKSARHRRRTPDLTAATASPPMIAREQPAPPPGQIDNPFLD